MTRVGETQELLCFSAVVGELLQYGQRDTFGSSLPVTFFPQGCKGNAAFQKMIFSNVPRESKLLYFPIVQAEKVGLILVFTEIRFFYAEIKIVPLHCQCIWAKEPAKMLIINFFHLRLCIPCFGKVLHFFI